MMIRFKDVIGTAAHQVPPDTTITQATLRFYNTQDLGAARASSNNPLDPDVAKDPQLNEGLIQLSPLLVPVRYGTSDGLPSKGESTGNALRRGKDIWWSRGEPCGYPDTLDDPFIAETACGPVPAGSPPATDPGECFRNGCLGFGSSGVGTSLWGRHWVIAEGYQGDYDPADPAAIEVFQDDTEGFKDFDVTQLVADGRLSNLGVYLTVVGNEPATLENNVGQAYRSSEFGGSTASTEDIASRPTLVVEFSSASSGIPGDITGDGTVDVGDLAIVGAQWGTADPDADLNNDGMVDVSDLAIVGSKLDGIKPHL